VIVAFMCEAIGGDKDASSKKQGRDCMGKRDFELHKFA
jgi:hypothetical protein